MIEILRRNTCSIFHPYFSTSITNKYSSFDLIKVSIHAEQTHFLSTFDNFQPLHCRKSHSSILTPVTIYTRPHESPHTLPWTPTHAPGPPRPKSPHTAPKGQWNAIGHHHNTTTNSISARGH